MSGFRSRRQGVRVLGVVALSISGWFVPCRGEIGENDEATQDYSEETKKVLDDYETARKEATAAMLLEAERTVEGNQYSTVGPGKKMSADELHAVHKASDADADGKMSLHELMNFFFKTRLPQAKRASPRMDVKASFQAMDANGDGRISIKEFSPPETHGDRLRNIAERKFQVADRDKDAFLSVEELISVNHPETSPEMQAFLAAETVKRHDADDDSHLSLHEFFTMFGDFAGVGAGNSDTHEAEHFFAKLDVDRNEKLSVEEMISWESGDLHTRLSLEEAFRVADMDSDGHLTSHELKANDEALSKTSAHYILTELSTHAEL